MTVKLASREVRLKWFARQVIFAACKGDAVDSSELVGWALAAGLVEEHHMVSEVRPQGSAPLGAPGVAGRQTLSLSSDLQIVHWAELADGQPPKLD